MDAEAIQRWDALARANWTYYEVPDGTTRLWRSFAAQALAGHAWSGDCADLSATALDLLSRAGTLTSNLYRLEVDSSNCGHADHCIAATWDDQGQAWIVGDTFHPAYPAGQCLHTPVSYQRLDETYVTRQGAPWAA